MDVCRTCLNERGSELVGSDFRSIFTNIEVDEVNVYIADCLTQWVDRTVSWKKIVFGLSTLKFCHTKNNMLAS